MHLVPSSAQFLYLVQTKSSAIAGSGQRASVTVSQHLKPTTAAARLLNDIRSVTSE